jgi:hypothetical protein
MQSRSHQRHTWPADKMLPKALSFHGQTPEQRKCLKRYHIKKCRNYTKSKQFLENEI